MFYYLYKVTNLINGKIYVGVHRTEDLDDGYMGSGKILKKAKDKYGLENFTKEILSFYETVEEMLEAEAQVVNEEFVKDGKTYNLCIGGAPGNTTPTTDDTKKKMSIAHLGSKRTPEQRQKMSDAQQNRKPMSEEVREKIREARAKQIMRTGWNHSEESKQKIRETRKERNIPHPNPMDGKEHSEETKKRIGEKTKERNLINGNPMQGRKHSEETKAKMREAKRKNKAEESK